MTTSGRIPPAYSRRSFNYVVRIYLFVLYFVLLDSFCFILLSGSMFCFTFYLFYLFDLWF
jgi:hypothetical protein